METLDTYVKCLGKMDYRRDAWKTSRPKFTEENLNFERIEEMDLSLNSMCVYTYEIRSSIWFRDLLFSQRPIAPWAASTRSIPLSKYTLCLSSEHKKSKMGQDGVEEFFKLVNAGESRDKARALIPLTTSTTYTFTIDHRIMISFCKAIDEMNHRLYLEYCVPMLVEAGIDQEMYRDSNFRSSLEYHRIDEAELIGGSHTTGNMIHGHYKMKLALASQFLRQHYSKIKIGLWNITTDYYHLDLRQADPIDVVFYTDVRSYHHLMSLRSHWVLDHSLDMWGTIVGDYIKDMSPAEFWDFTPAGGAKTDPYWADVYNRVILEDPGIPCPIMTEWRGAIEQRRKETPDSPVLDMYERLFDEGFIKDNPDNELRVQYFNLLEKQDGPQ